MGIITGMDYGKGQEVLQRRNGRNIIRKWEGWLESKSKALFEELNDMDSQTGNNRSDLLFDGAKRMAMKGVKPKFKH